MNIAQNDIKPAWYSRKWAQIFLHTVVWITLFSLPYLLRPSEHRGRDHEPDDPMRHVHYILTSILLTLFFYLNAGVLIPKLVYRKKYLEFVIVILTLFGALVASKWLFTHAFMKNKWFDLRFEIMLSFFPLTFMLACSTAWRMIRDKMNSDKLASERENENLKTELSLLRSQVSPHFMFNVLNNMVALARKQSDQLEPSLINLSSLMRYMLYEADEDTVPLDKETDYLQSYIDLQQQRFGAKVQVNVSMQLPENGYEIEPMLLIPFVENAFKHGTGLIQDARIDIELRAKQGLLQFSVMNRYNAEYEEVKDKTSGIGLTNVKRRLNLLYKDKYQLLINKKDGWFVVSLQLHLH
jgi:two-component system, LytTR family, sensor kinase